MANKTVPPEIRCWNIELDAVGYADNERWFDGIELSRFDSLLQFHHKQLPLVLDLDWFDPDGPDQGLPPERRRGGKFRLRVILNADWENPIDGNHITHLGDLNEAIRRMIVRHG